MTKHICEKCDGTMQLVCPTCDARIRAPNPHIAALIAAAREVITGNQARGERLDALREALAAVDQYGKEIQK